MEREVKQASKGNYDVCYNTDEDNYVVFVVKFDNNEEGIVKFKVEDYNNLTGNIIENMMESVKRCIKKEMIALL